ncbi:MAG: DUF1573 domain-containing protein [Planctomycetaceae bacterium]|nr:DUF1573 domain-containing protein [Planctomycetaceae bacterium]
MGDDWTQNVIKQEDRTVDFKTVAKGTKTEHRFVLKNPFEDTLHLSSITSSCLCTTPVLEGGKGELRTYEEAVITAQFRTDLFEGKRNATISVVIDKPNRAEILLNVSGDIRTDITVKPESVMYKQVEVGREHKRTFTVEYAGQNSSWRILEIKSSNKNIRAEVIDTKIQLGKKTFTVSVVLSSETGSGIIADNLYLVTNNAAGREIPIAVSATVGSVITVNPPTVFIGSLKLGEEPPMKNIVLRGTEPFKITQITCDNPAIEIPFEIAADTPPKVMYLVPIKYKNTQFPPDGKLQALVKIKTDNKGQQPEIYVTATVAEK